MLVSLHHHCLKFICLYTCPPHIIIRFWLNLNELCSKSVKRSISHNMSDIMCYFKEHVDLWSHPSANGFLQWHHKIGTGFTAKQTADPPDVTADGAREQPPPSVTCRLMNSRLVPLTEEPFGPQEPCVLTTFCLDTHKQWDTSGVLGAQTPRKGRWRPGSRTAPPLTWEKRGTEAGEQVPSLLFPPSIEIKRGWLI